MSLNECRSADSPVCGFKSAADCRPANGLPTIDDSDVLSLPEVPGISHLPKAVNNISDVRPITLKEINF